MNREPFPYARWADALLFCLFLALTGLLACVANQDTDLWWHLKTGQAILDGRGIPTQDTYTIAAAGHEWIDLHWLFQTAAAWLHARCGMEGLTIAAAAAAMLAVGAGILGSSTSVVAPFAVVVWLPAVLVMSSRFYVRPEMATLICLALYLSVLRHAETSPNRLWLLVPIQVFWVNVQGLFCLGPFLLGCWMIDRFLHADPEGRRRFGNETAGASIAVALACFVNPYGWRGAVFPLALVKTMFVEGPYFREHIGELASPLMIWQATGYRDIYVWSALVLFVMTCCSFLASGVRIRVFRVTVFAIFSGLGLTALRNLPQFALIAGFILTWNLPERTMQAEDARRYGPAVRLISLATVILLAFSLPGGTLYSLIGSSRVFGLKEYPLWHAHDAARFVAQNGMPERVLAYHEGQAALVEYYQRDPQRVYADARLEVMQRPVMEGYYLLAKDIATAEKNWSRRVSPPELPMAILIDHSTHFQLEATLLSNPDWNCAWFDGVAAVYVPKEALSAPRDPSGDFAGRHFGGIKNDRVRSSGDAGALRNGLNADLLEASALLQIARSAADRPTQDGTDRRLLVLLAMRHARSADGEPAHAACRIGAGAALQMYSIPSTQPGDWQLLELLGPARSRYLLHRCRQLQPRHFATLAEEYAVVSALADIDATVNVSQQIAVSRAQSAQQVRMQSLARQNLNAAQLRGLMGGNALTDAADDLDQQITELFEARRFQRIQFRFASTMSEPNSASQFSGSSRDFVARACLLCGDPKAARTVWEQAPDAASDSHICAGVGMSYLVEQEHSLALEHFGQAVRNDPSNSDAHGGLALCHLELGDAAAAADECDLVLKAPTISEGLQRFCERLRDFANRYRRDEN